jgi:hypothetical protein
MVIVGMGMAAPAVRAVAGATVPLAVMLAEGNGDPVGLTIPVAITLLLAVISAFAVKRGVAVGWEISHVRVAAELGLGRAAGVFISIESVTVDVAAPAEQV